MKAISNPKWSEIFCKRAFLLLYLTITRYFSNFLYLLATCGKSIASNFCKKIFFQILVSGVLMDLANRVGIFLSNSGMSIFWMLCDALVTWTGSSYTMPLNSIAITHLGDSDVIWTLWTVHALKYYHFYKKDSTPLHIHLFLIYQYIMSIVLLDVIKSIYFVCTYISTQCIKCNLSIIAAKSISLAQMFIRFMLLT